MKRLQFTLFIIVVLTSATAIAQGFSSTLRLADSDAPPSTVYMHFSGEVGYVLNSMLNLKPGIGATVSILIPDDRFDKIEKNYFTLGIKGLNNPHENERYLSTMNIGGDKEIDDSFNYFQILAGYRYSDRIREDGWYFEPRVGYILWDFHDNDFLNQAFVLSPTFGYVYKNFDFAVFSDSGFSQRPSNIGRKAFYTLGISIGYDIGFYKRNKCNCDYYY